MFSYSQTLEFYRMCVIVVVGNVVQHEWPILMWGAFFCGGIFCGVLGSFMRVCFVFPRDTPLTQKAVNCNEWSLIIAPLDPVSLYRKEIKKVFEDYGRLYFSFYWEEVVGTLRRGFILAHYDIVITFCCFINMMLTLVITLSGVAGPQNCTQCDHQCQSVTLAAGAQTRIATIEALGAQTSWLPFLSTSMIWKICCHTQFDVYL